MYTVDNRKSHKRSRLKLWLLIASISLVLLGVGGFIGVQQWYGSQLRPVVAGADATAKNQLFTVKSGASAGEIAAGLQEAGLIRNARVFTWYIDREGLRTKLKAGTYSLSPAQSVQDIARFISEGLVDASLLTIAPGLRLDEIKQVFYDNGFSKAEVKAGFAEKYDAEILKTKPKKATLEGYIFPESFEVNSETTVSDVLERSFELFDAQVDDGLRAGVKEQGLTMHEAVILASIVGRESPNEREQRLIAQVFLKRLDEGISLGADPTFFYAAAILGVEPYPGIDSPYNTRIYTGLPPGPIANFNFSALAAVADPANTDYLFFVGGDDGVTRFSKTEEEHQRLAEKYCVELCKIGSGE